MRKNHSKIVCIKLVHLPYLYILTFEFYTIECISRPIKVIEVPEYLGFVLLVTFFPRMPHTHSFTYRRRYVIDSIKSHTVNSQAVQAPRKWVLN